MEGYDTTLLGQFFVFPQFTQKYGMLDTKTTPETFQLSAAWQTGLQNGAQVGEILGLYGAGIVVDRYVYENRSDLGSEREGRLLTADGNLKIRLSKNDDRSSDSYDLLYFRSILLAKFGDVVGGRDTPRNSLGSFSDHGRPNSHKSVISNRLIHELRRCLKRFKCFLPKRHSSSSQALE